MEGVDQMSAVMAHSQQRVGLAQCNPYAIEVDKGRNCYSYGEFGYLAWNCRR